MKIGKKIKSKILMSSILVVLFSLLLLGIIVYFYFTDVLKERSINDNVMQMQQNSQHMHDIVDDIEKAARTIAIDTDFQNFLNSSYSSPLEELLAVNSIKAHLEDFLIFQTNIESFAIVTDDESVYWNVLPYDDYFKKEMEKSWYQDYKRSGKNMYFSKPHSLLNWDGRGDSEVISYIIKIRDISRHQNVIGELILNVYLEPFTDYIDIVSQSYDDFLWINSDGHEMYRKAEEAKGVDWVQDILEKNDDSNELVQVIEQSDRFLLTDSLDNGWTFVACITKNQLYSRMNNILLFVAIAILISFILVVVILYPLLNGITKPISLLSSTMEKVSDGDLDAHISIKSGDEIEILGDCFNSMLSNLKTHMDGIIKKEETLRNMEFELLIAQINPHFIYNTLNSIIYLSRAQKNENIEEVTYSLIRILQDSIKIDKKNIYFTLEQEIEIVDHYVTIQKIRYSNRFELQWDLRLERFDYKVPKTIIQPLVENALFHGILPQNEKGLIKVTVWAEEKQIVIEVQDNGIGMNEEIIKDIFSSKERIKNNSKMRSIGVSNLKERIEFLFGSEYGVGITSAPGEGTHVTVRMPVIGYDE